MRLLYQSVYGSPYSTFRHSWIPPQVLNFSACCSVLLLTCSEHWLGFLERHNTSVCLVLIFIPAWSDITENRSATCWGPCSEDARSTKSSAKSKRLILKLSTVTFSSTRLWLSIPFTSMKRSSDSTHSCWRQHPWGTFVIKLRWHGHKLLSRNTITWRPVTGGRHHRTLATLPKAFQERPRCVFSRGRQNICRRLWHITKISQKFSGEWKFGL